MNVHILWITRSFESFITNFAEVEQTSVRFQVVSLHRKQETGRPLESVCFPTGIWSLFIHYGGSTATESRNPTPVDDERNLRRKKDPNPRSKSPEDENSCSAFYLRFPCSQNRAGVSARLTNDPRFWNLMRNPMQEWQQVGSSLFCSQKSCVSSSWSSTRKIVCGSQLPVFCDTTATILVRGSKLDATRLVGRRFALLLRIPTERLREYLNWQRHHFPSIDVRSETLSIARSQKVCGRGSVMLALFASSSIGAPRNAASLSPLAWGFGGQCWSPSTFPTALFLATTSLCVVNIFLVVMWAAAPLQPTVLMLPSGLARIVKVWRNQIGSATGNLHMVVSHVTVVWLRLSHGYLRMS